MQRLGFVYPRKTIKMTFFSNLLRNYFVSLFIQSSLNRRTSAKTRRQNQKLTTFLRAREAFLALTIFSLKIIIFSLFFDFTHTLKNSMSQTLFGALFDAIKTNGKIHTHTNNTPLYPLESDKFREIFGSFRSEKNFAKF